MTHVVGIDTSTTATKAIIVDESGSVVGVGTKEYGYETPHPLWTEQDPNLWWDATVEAIRAAFVDTGIDPADIAGVGLTGQMHGLVLLGGDNRPLRPAILWNDQRTGPETDEIRSRIGRDHLIEVTGNDALTGFTAPKILWVRNHEPDVFAEARHVLLPKDYVRLQLTGAHATDRAGGSGTVLFDLAGRTWSPEILSSLDLDPSWFPETYEGPAITGVVSEAAAAATGLKAGTPVVAGGGDQAANAVGVGAISEEAGALSLGTSGVVFVSTNSPRIEPGGRLHAFCHAVPETWHLMGVMLSAAGSLRWFLDTLAPRENIEEVVRSAADVPPGADGLSFLPYLTGERTPHPDPLARGAFVGLTVRHTRAHMVRAVLEGVAFGLGDCLQLIREAGVPVTELRASGGGTRSGLWRQIISDVLAVDLVGIGTTEGAAYGAAVLAAVGAQMHTDVASAVSAWIQLGERTSPSDRAADYAAHHVRYRSLYPALRDTFHGLA